MLLTDAVCVLRARSQQGHRHPAQDRLQWTGRLLHVSILSGTEFQKITPACSQHDGGYQMDAFAPNVPARDAFFNTVSKKLRLSSLLISTMKTASNAARMSHRCGPILTKLSPVSPR